MKLFGIFLMLLFWSTLYGDIQGLGFGKHLDDAKKDALADMSQVIKSDVHSIYKSHTTDASSDADYKVCVTSNLPLLGVGFKQLSDMDGFEVEALLHSDKAIPLYRKKLNRLNQEMQATLHEIGKSHNSSFKLSQYETLYATLATYEKYQSVLNLLDPSITITPIVSKAKIRSSISQLSANIHSLALASDVIAQSFQKKAIYVYPPTLVNNHNISEFGSLFQTYLQGKLHTATTLQNAKYILLGTYVIEKKSLLLTMQLLDAQTKDVVVSKTITINSDAYKGIKLKPAGVDFDRLLHNGVIQSSKLRVALSTNQGSENLLFREGEDVKLLVKLNKQGYIYIVGYTQTKKGKFSYLLELNDAEGSSKFTKFINADDASHWISLGEFTLQPPFGIEGIEVFASNKKITNLPKVTYDATRGYYIINKKIKKALQYTRGLQLKRSNKREKSEAVLTFTTVKDSIKY